jgi:hypothetical protein
LQRSCTATITSSFALQGVACFARHQLLRKKGNCSLPCLAVLVPCLRQGQQLLRKAKGSCFAKKAKGKKGKKQLLRKHSN